MSTADVLEVGSTHTACDWDGAPSTRTSGPASFQHPSQACHGASGTARFCAMAGLAADTARRPATSVRTRSAPRLSGFAHRVDIVTIPSESDKESHTGGEPRKVYAVKSDEVGAEICTGGNVLRFGGERPARAERPIDTGERLRHGRPAGRVELVAEDVLRGIVHEFAALAERVIHQPGTCADVRREAGGHPREVSDAPAAIEQVVPTAQRDRNAPERRRLLNRKAVAAHVIPRLGTLVDPGVRHVEHEVE